MLIFHHAPLGNFQQPLLSRERWRRKKYSFWQQPPLCAQTFVLFFFLNTKAKKKRRHLRMTRPWFRKLVGRVVLFEAISRCLQHFGVVWAISASSPCLLLLVWCSERPYWSSVKVTSIFRHSKIWDLSENDSRFVAPKLPTTATPQDSH